MVENTKAVNNPLTIIAIFAGLAEVAGTVVLALLDGPNQAVFMWFVMLFPCLLVLLFFGTLLFRSRALYAPSDFRDDQSFLTAHALFRVDSAGTALDEASTRILTSIDEKFAGLASLEPATGAESPSDELRGLIASELETVRAELVDMRQALGAGPDRALSVQKETRLLANAVEHLRSLSVGDEVVERDLFGATFLTVSQRVALLNKLAALGQISVAKRGPRSFMAKGDGVPRPPRPETRPMAAGDPYGF